MAFQPFGYPFEVASRLPPEHAKAALRGKWKGWFDAKSGPRGWIVGPFLCLWLSAFDRHGPMVLGRISADNFGTRVRGRAGSDLNGVITFSLLTLLMAHLVYKLISTGQATGRALLVIGAVFLIGGPLFFWIAHKDRRQAEPLVHFVRVTLGELGAAPSHPPRLTGNGLVVRLIDSDEHVIVEPTPEMVRQALTAMAQGEFFILERAPEEYLQVAMSDEGYLLEKREGNPESHFAAELGFGESVTSELEETLVGYLYQKKPSTTPLWVKIKR